MGAISDFTYVIGATAIDKLPLISYDIAVAICALSAKFLIWNPTTNVWDDDSAASSAWVNSFSTTTGALQISQTAGAY